MRTNEIYNEKRNSCQNQSDHIQLMWAALQGGTDAIYTTKENGEGTVHVFSFKKEDAPDFQTVSNDVFSQIEIKLT